MDDLSTDIQRKVELEYVRSTYDSIAHDFSNTRYKRWPKVDKYLKSMPPGTLCLDVGCGNGKYLDNHLTFTIGCDISVNLLLICRQRGFEVVQCDMTRLPFRDDLFDSLISVAALHHVVTAKRREECLKDQVKLLEPQNGTMLIQVWAFEQELDDNNPYLRSGESEVPSTGRQVTIDKDISIPVHKNRTQFACQDLLVPFHINTRRHDHASNCDSQINEKEQLRYYHLFKHRELDKLAEKISHLSIEESYYDRGNWCLILKRQTRD